VSDDWDDGDPWHGDLDMGPLPNDDEPGVVYTRVGGLWTRTEYARQCPKDMLFARCQGAEGHDGDHWHYSRDGASVRSMPDGGCVMVSPLHDSWISPRDMAHLRYLGTSTVSSVTDPVVVIELEFDRAPEPWAVIDREVDPEELPTDDDDEADL
jgi:hypothetical protein